MTLEQADRDELLRLARETVRSAVARSPRPQPGPIAPGSVLGEPRGCFVTLTNAGRLRGCIGTFQPREPLAATVVEMAVHACHDPRFTGDPITAGELDQLDIKLSILSPLTPIADPLKVQVGVHGIYVVSGGRSGCFLPEVATEQGWGVEEFLSTCCAHKAGLPPDAWKGPGTQVLTFTTESFH